jgi:sugar phosphate isomerase/epimerase
MAAVLQPQRSMFVDLGVTLAIELHFEFTTFELVRLFEMLDAEPNGWLGVCLDTFNVLPLLEDPVAATRRILPWVVSTHVKDGALMIADAGLISFPTTAGTGLVDLRSIFRLLSSLHHPVTLSVEDHGGSFTTDFNDPQLMDQFPDVTPTEMEQLLATARRGNEKVRTGELAVTERDDWPQQCQERTRTGLRNVQHLAEEWLQGPTDVTRL